MRVSLVNMKAGQSGRLIGIMGGHGMVNRLGDMGLRIGKSIRKVSSMLMGGPVVVEVDGFQVAVGYGMASRIIVEIAESENTVNGKP